MKEKANNNPVQKIIEKSGNSFHSRVVKLLRDEKWTVLVSPYYSDNFTDKPREIDIVAERKFDVNGFGGGWLGTLDVRLFVECKYINNKTVFWFDEKDQPKAIERMMTDTGMEHPHHNVNIQKLHYFSNTPVAKLFTSEKSRNEDNELISKAINQNLNALIYYRGRNDLIPENPNRRTQILRRISYPIIVVNSFDNFFRTSMTDNTVAAELITEPFQLEVNYAYVDKDRNGRNEYFLIDVVNLDKLTEFFSMLIKNDITEVTEKIRWEKAQEKPRHQQGYSSHDINPL